MRTLVIIMGLTVVGSLRASAQESSGESNAFDLSSDSALVVSAEVSKPPIAFDVGFSEPSGNSFLDAEETGTLEITVRNTGIKPASCVQTLVFFLSDSSGLRIGELPAIAPLAAGAEKSLTVQVIAGAQITGRVVRMGVALKECSGLRCEPPAQIEFNTKAKKTEGNR